MKQNLPDYEFSNFDIFFDAFVASELPYGDYFAHVADWTAARHLPNVLLVTYEALHRERERIVRDIADFIGVRLDAQALKGEWHTFEIARIE